MASATATGRIAQVIGSTFDAEFNEGHLPEIYNALTVTAEEMGIKIDLTGEVQQHLGEKWVRTIAMSSTEGLKRGMPVNDTGGPISVPVGEGTLGRIFNVTGDPVDNRGPVSYTKRYPIHRPAPTLTEQDTGTTTLETGIKGIDVLAPLERGGKAGLFGGAGVGTTVLLPELIHNMFGHQQRLSIFCGIGERARQAPQPYRGMPQAHLPPRTRVR